MENIGTVTVALDCCGGEDGSRLESPHGDTIPDHSPSSVDHHHVALATAKIIERAGIKENSVLPNGKIKHRSDENGLINQNHHVLTTGSSSETSGAGGGLLGSVTSGVVVVEADSDNYTYERCPSANAPNSTKNVMNNNNNQSSSSSSSSPFPTSNSSGGDAHDKDEEDGTKGDNKPLSMSIQSRTYQSHGDQVDCLSQQINTLNISSSSTKDKSSDIFTPTDTAKNIINESIIGWLCSGTDDNKEVDKANNSDDGTARVPSSCSFSSATTSSCTTRADNTGTVVAVVNDDNDNNNNGEGQLEYCVYECELQMADIMRLITRDLSEPYSIYTYRYFIHNWPKLCFLCMDGSKCVGAIVCKLDIHKRVIRRGYIAMLAVDAEYRRRKIGSNLVLKAIRAMLADGCDEVVLETEITNKAALKLYENLGFVRDKRLFRYYLNGVDALRLKLWLR